MKIIDADANYLNPEGLHPYQFMELAGRTCYKSEDKMTDTSAKKFVSNLLKAGHTAMLEHAHIIIQTTGEHAENFRDKLSWNQSYQGRHANLSNYINVTVNSRSDTYGGFISGSFRAFIQLFRPNDYGNKILYDSKIEDALHFAYPELFDASDYKDATSCKIISRSEFISAVRHAYCYADVGEIANSVIDKHLTHTVKFTCDRGVSHEFVRHRPASFAQESTRYCNYSNDKFGNEISVIRPCYWPEDSAQMMLWKTSCEYAETAYFKLLDVGATAQEARSVLPNSLKTELIITATEDEWQHIINLRYHGTTGKPHPQMYEVMEIAYPQLVEKSCGRLK